MSTRNSRDSQYTTPLRRKTMKRSVCWALPSYRMLADRVRPQIATQIVRPIQMKWPHWPLVIQGVWRVNYYQTQFVSDFITALNHFRVNKFGAGGGGGDDTTSRDSDSLIQEYINMPPTEMYPHCWNHPKIRENWRTVLAAVLLLVIGIVLVTMGIFAIANPANSSQGFVFLLAGECSVEVTANRTPTNWYCWCSIFFPPPQVSSASYRVLTT